MDKIKRKNKNCLSVLVIISNANVMNFDFVINKR